MHAETGYNATAIAGQHKGVPEFFALVSKFS